MSIHTGANYECPKCQACYIPYKYGISCPKCGEFNSDKVDFLKSATESLQGNLERFGSYIPDTWLAMSFSDQILELCFPILEGYRVNGGTTDFQEHAREWLQGVEFGPNEYLREHTLSIVCELQSALTAPAGGTVSPD